MKNTLSLSISLESVEKGQLVSSALIAGRSVQTLRGPHGIAR